MTDENEDLQGEKPASKDKKTSAKIKWSIFTEPETKIAANKAAQRSQMKLNEWIDKTLRETATNELTTRPEPPARIEDMITNLAEQFAATLKKENAENTAVQAKIIEDQAQQITDLKDITTNLMGEIQSRPATLKEFLFGKSKNA